MKLDAIWARYQGYTREATDQARKLGFGVAGVCWFFKSPAVTFPTPILVSLSFVVLFFCCDLAQSVTGAYRRRRFARREEKRHWNDLGAWEAVGLPDFDVEVPEDLDDPVYRWFWAKLVFLAAASASLLVEFGGRIFA